MKAQEIKILLQRYFNGESSLEDEKMLEAYFTGENVAEELQEYAEFFGGLSVLSGSVDDSTIEEDVMDYILENEHLEKTRFRKMWITVTGIAASVIIVLGGFLFFQEQQKPFKDTYKNPEQAFAVAQQTLQFVGSKYNKGVAELSNFGKLEKGKKTMKKGVAPVNTFFDEIKKMQTGTVQNQIKEKQNTGNDSI